MGGFELVGATEAVEALARAIRQIGSSEFRRKLLEELAVAAQALVEEEFFLSRDPYGTPWAPLKRPRFGAGPLVRTGKLQSSIRRKIVGDGFTLRSATPYAQFHQSGTSRMRARPMFPTDQQLPAAWEAAFEQIADQAIRRALESSL